MIYKKQIGANKISEIIFGGRQLAQGHGNNVDSNILSILLAYASIGVVTFDCADIYTGVEKIYGRMIKEIKNKKPELLTDIKIHTKCVPNINDIKDGVVDRVYIEKIIDTSLKNLGVDQLDLVQYHHRDYNTDTYCEILGYLQEIKQKGKISQLGVTNFNSNTLEKIINTGIDIVSTQNQYSLLDRRVEKKLQSLCKKNNIKILCYGTLAGGLLTSKYLGVKKPKEPVENRSLRKYLLIIEEFGGWEAFQSLLRELHKIALKNNVTIADISMKYILEKPQVGGIIVGTRNTKYIDKIKMISNFDLDYSDYINIDAILSKSEIIKGDCFDLERESNKHKNIMKMNLNE